MCIFYALFLNIVTSYLCADFYLTDIGEIVALEKLMKSDDAKCCDGLFDVKIANNLLNLGFDLVIWRFRVYFCESIFKSSSFVIEFGFIEDDCGKLLSATWSDDDDFLL